MGCGFDERRMAVWDQESGNNYLGRVNKVIFVVNSIPEPSAFGVLLVPARWRWWHLVAGTDEVGCSGHKKTPQGFLRSFLRSREGT